jgi:hypothetical protein
MNKGALFYFVLVEWAPPLSLLRFDPRSRLGSA